MATFDQRFPDSDWTMGSLAGQDDYQAPQVDPLTGAVTNPSPAAQAKFGRIADAIGGGLRNWVETPGRAYQQGLTPEEEADWGAGTAFGMLGTGAPIAMTGAVPRGLGAAGGKLGAAAPQEARFAQYTERYPEVGPPVEAVDPKTKATYLAKQLTPEAEAFAKERTRIMRDMNENGFTPYFDPEQRFHVDPTNYPPNIDTTTIVPKKQATIDKYMETLGSEDVRQRLRDAYARGAAMPDTDRWYALGQLEKAFIDELGPEAGRKAFQDRVATSMAATTGGADPTSNWLMAQYGNYLRANNLPYPQAAYEMPVPIGGRYATGNMAQHQKIFDAGGMFGEANPKRHNFAQDFTGNQRAATMDEQMTSGMTPGKAMPPSGTYGLYERVMANEAAKLGVTPQEYQAIAWSGFKNAKDPSYVRGDPFINTVNESIERTHRLTGMPRDEILKRGIIRSEIPVYNFAGGMPIGSLADPSTYGTNQ